MINLKEIIVYLTEQEVETYAEHTKNYDTVPLDLFSEIIADVIMSAHSDRNNNRMYENKIKISVSLNLSLI